MSKPPLATKAILIAALPALLSEWAILPPSSFDAARVWKVLHFDGKVGDDREEPYSTAILVLVPSARAGTARSRYERKGKTGEGMEDEKGGEEEKRTKLVRGRLMVWIYQ
jgi:hypothetical protein